MPLNKDRTFADAEVRLIEITEKRGMGQTKTGRMLCAVQQICANFQFFKKFVALTLLQHREIS